MVLAAKGFGPQKAKNPITVTLHFRRLPAGEMFFEIVTGRMSLAQKTAGREEHHFFGGELFHFLHQLEPVLFGEMLDQIEGDTGVELPRLEILAKISDIAEDKLVLRVPAFGLVE